MALPQSILLKSNKNNKLLRYKKEEDSEHGFLQFSQDEEEENPEVQYTKFEVEKSKTVEGFVHIRSCYNHKYWVRKSADSKSIVVEANEPEEDQSKWCCTLFKAELVSNEVDAKAVGSADGDVLPKPQKIRLVHIDQLGQQACVQSSETTDLVLIDEEDEGSRSSWEEFLVAYDARSIMVLPEYIAIMDENDKFGTTTGGLSIGRPYTLVLYLGFKANDIFHTHVTHRVVQLPYLSPPVIYVINKFISESPNPALDGVWRVRRAAGSDFVTMTEHSSTMHGRFTPIGLGGSMVALRLSMDGKDRLYATSFKSRVNDGTGKWVPEPVLALLNASTSIDRSATLRLVEPVLTRQVRNVVFSDPRVYNVGPVTKFTQERSNYTSVEQTVVFRVMYTITQTRSWNDSISLARTLQASWYSKIPYVGEFGVDYLDEQPQIVEWGKQIVELENIDAEHTVRIPPRKKVSFSVIGTRADYDIPFTYQVRDSMADGTTVTHTKTDGFVVGSNEFNVQARILESDV